MHRVLEKLACLAAPLVLFMILYGLGTSPSSESSQRHSATKLTASFGIYHNTGPVKKKENDLPAMISDSYPEAINRTGLKNSKLKTEAENIADFSFHEVTESDLGRIPTNLAALLNEPILEKFASRQLRPVAVSHQISTAQNTPGSSLSLDSIPDQSFDAFYATLFADKSKADLIRNTWPVTPAQIAENPFGEAIETQRTTTSNPIQNTSAQNTGPMVSSSSTHNATGSASIPPTAIGSTNNSGLGSASASNTASTTASPSGTGIPASGLSNQGSTGSPSPPASSAGSGLPPASSDQAQAPPGAAAPAKPPAPQPTLSGTNSGSFIVAGDIKHSGMAEIVPAIHYQNGRFEIPFMGTVQFKVAVVADPLNTFRSLVVEDINNDSLPDVVWFSEVEPFVLVWLGLPSGEFTYTGVSPIINRGKSAAILDVDGDRIKDLAIIESSESNHLGLYKGNGSGRFQYIGTWNLPSASDMLNVGDFDGDGNLDLFASNLSSLRTFMLLGQASGGLTPAFFSFQFMPQKVMESDINFNGVQEKIALFQYGSRFSIAMNQGLAPLRHLVGASLKLPVFIVLGDLLGEGRIDMGVAVAGR